MGGGRQRIGIALPAGPGRRLLPDTDALPKALLPVFGDITILDIALRNLATVGLSDVAVGVGRAGGPAAHRGAGGDVAARPGPVLPGRVRRGSPPGRRGRGGADRGCRVGGGRRPRRPAPRPANRAALLVASTSRQEGGSPGNAAAR